eukprot:TRINITY_DN22211_c0_g1_i1.p1 TRINITY_DN22211_c0_g1~~TRINITY_DN22211_c0_g1_i1.p1  ORF type:complete len:378 (-),score=32.71 TRINITY_DN22211_c0_g1_i1:121-1173(-)
MVRSSAFHSATAMALVVATMVSTLIAMEQNSVSEAAAGAVVNAAAPNVTDLFSTCSSLSQHRRYMNCGRGVSLCGVLTLETGHGSGPYHHWKPVVHGLWPQVPPYGNSRCVAPISNAGVSRLCPCYATGDSSYARELGFERHEWTSHGVCAGVASPDDFFAQICALAAGPLQVIQAALQRNMDVYATAGYLQSAGYCVWHTASQSQIELSACARPDGRWVLADSASFEQVCGTGTPSSPRRRRGGGVSAMCIHGRRGPPCSSDYDCSGKSGCARCAHSGYCTDIPYSVAQAEVNAHGIQGYPGVVAFAYVAAVSLVAAVAWKLRTFSPTRHDVAVGVVREPLLPSKDVAP